MAKEMTKTTTKKTTTSGAKKTEKKQTEPIINSEDTVSDLTVEKEIAYSPTDEIRCVSVTAGELIMIGRKTGNVYSWANYGDSEPVEYQDLKSEKFNSKSRYIYDPLFIIDDDNLLATPEFKAVREVYNNILSADDIEELFNLDNISFRKTLASLPRGIQNSIRSLAAGKIQDGVLDSLQKIRAIDEILGTDLFNAYLGED